MNKAIFLIFYIFICFGVTISAQSLSISESTPDSTIFQNYLDSIEKYIYRDSRKSLDYKLLCEQMLAEEKELSNKDHFEFIIQDIYYQYTQDKPLEVLKIIETNKKMLELDGITPKQRSNFTYLVGFTAMELGDYEDAQKTFLELLKTAKVKKDTLTIIQSLHSLGQLHTYQEQFELAEKCFLDRDQFAIGKEPIRQLHFLLNWVNLYILKKDLEKAKNYNEISIIIADSLKALDFKFDFLLQKGKIALAKKNVLTAKISYDEAFALSQSLNNIHYKKSCKKLLGEIYVFQLDYKKALNIYEELIQMGEEEILTESLEYYKEAHKAAHLLGKYNKAYNYLFKANEIKDSLTLEEQIQKTQYLNIKFEAEQREKENEILTAQVLQKQSQNNFLYAVSFIFFLFIIFLIGAFFQKRKYNNRLKEEVKIRTKELKKANTSLSKSNEELNQFNKILSHDLKEPLRSIVGFSSLAHKENNGNTRLKEYLNYISKSGKQLHQLIEDVSIFQKVGNKTSEEFKMVATNKMVNSILNSIQSMLFEKKARVHFQNLPIIYTNSSLLFLVFKNIIENGIKYNENVPPVITITYEQKNNQHCFLFADNGIGIAPQFHEKVFGMFNRLHDRGAYEGSGLGLNIVKKLMDKVEGNVGILHSEEGKGSTFEVSFPIIEQEESHTYNMSIPDSN